MRLPLGDVLVELCALIRREDLAHRGDALLEPLLHLGATCGEAGGVAALAARTRLRSGLAVRRARMVLLPCLTLAGPEIGQFLLLIGREGDTAEEHALRPAAAAAGGAILLGGLRTSRTVRTIGGRRA